MCPEIAIRQHGKVSLSSRQQFTAAVRKHGQTVLIARRNNNLQTFKNKIRLSLSSKHFAMNTYGGGWR
jgi:hypothetical protein